MEEDMLMSPTVLIVYAPKDDTDRGLSEAEALLGAR